MLLTCSLHAFLLDFVSQSLEKQAEYHLQRKARMQERRRRCMIPYSITGRRHNNDVEEGESSCVASALSSDRLIKGRHAVIPSELGCNPPTSRLQPHDEDHQMILETEEDERNGEKYKAHLHSKKNTVMGSDSSPNSLSMEWSSPSSASSSGDSRSSHLP
ncbi:hypothetical protein CSUI_007020, partial [Cystoisospora suis]